MYRYLKAACETASSIRAPSVLSRTLSSWFSSSLRLTLAKSVGLTAGRVGLLPRRRRRCLRRLGAETAAAAATGTTSRFATSVLSCSSCKSSSAAATRFLVLGLEPVRFHFQHDQLRGFPGNGGDVLLNAHNGSGGLSVDRCQLGELGLQLRELSLPRVLEARDLLALLGDSAFSLGISGSSRSAPRPASRAQQRARAEGWRLLWKARLAQR